MPALTRSKWLKSLNQRKGHRLARFLQLLCSSHLQWHQRQPLGLRGGINKHLREDVYRRPPWLSLLVLESPRWLNLLVPESPRHDAGSPRRLS